MFVAAIAGTSFRSEEARARARRIGNGASLTLKAEPTNQFDKYAVQVLTEDGIHIGYVASEAKAGYGKVGNVTFLAQAVLWPTARFMKNADSGEYRVVIG